MKLKLIATCLMIFVGVFFVANAPVSAKKVGAACYFKTDKDVVNSTGTCHITAPYGYYGTNDVFAGRTTSGKGSAMPGSVNTKREFINFVVGRFGTKNSGLSAKQQQNRVGAAFIMQEMRGSHYWPSTANKNDWVARMNNPDITVKKTSAVVGKTSYFDNGKDNVFYYKHPNVKRTVLEVYYKGKRLAQIEYLCGNLVAGSSNLPTAPVIRTDWSLTPSVTGDSGIFEAGSEVSDVMASIDLSGTMNSDDKAEWWFGRVEVAPGGSVPGGGKNTNGPETYFGGSDKTVTKLGNATRRFTSDTVVDRDSSPTLDDLPTGAQVCWFLSVKPAENDYSGWRHSAPLCITIGKKPKLQVLGGDVRVGGKISTSISTINDGGSKTFGSWVEFGAISAGNNSGFGSGAGLRGGASSDRQTDWSDLTFANTRPVPPPSSDNDQFGHYADELPIGPAIKNFFESRTKGTFNGGSLSGVSGVKSAGGSVSISTSTINKTVVIVASGTVKITGDIKLSGGSLSSINDIPQVVIIAKNISISSSVTRIDAWLIADKWINTCSSIPVTGNSTTDPAFNKLAADICDEHLRVTGPVSSKYLYLYRTAGADGKKDIDKPAETFNLRPDAYLWAYNYGLILVQPNTLSTAELPPRY